MQQIFHKHPMILAISNLSLWYQWNITKINGLNKACIATAGLIRRCLTNKMKQTWRPGLEWPQHAMTNTGHYWALAVPKKVVTKQTHDDSNVVTICLTLHTLHVLRSRYLSKQSKQQTDDFMCFTLSYKSYVSLDSSFGHCLITFPVGFLK